MVNYFSKAIYFFLGFKYRGNLLSKCSNLLSFQGKFNAIKLLWQFNLKWQYVTAVFYNHFRLNYHSNIYNMNLHEKESKLQQQDNTLLQYVNPINSRVVYSSNLPWKITVIVLLHWPRVFLTFRTMKNVTQLQGNKLAAAYWYNWYLSTF